MSQKKLRDRQFFYTFSYGYRTLFLIAGGKTCLIGNDFFDVKPYDILIFRPDQIHKIIRDDGALYERYIILAKPYFLQEILNPEEYSVLQYLLRTSEAILLSLDSGDRQVLLRLLAEYNSSHASIFGHTLSKSKFIEIFVYIFTLLQKQGNLHESRLHQNMQVAPILDYIEKHLPDISLPELAAHFNLNKNYLCALFKKNTAMTVNEYILSKKIALAKKLLARGYNASETSNLCGFHDFSNFIRVFKKYTGTPPKKYQLRLKEERIQRQKQSTLL